MCWSSELVILVLLLLLLLFPMRVLIDVLEAADEDAQGSDNDPVELNCIVHHLGI